MPSSEQSAAIARYQTYRPDALGYATVKDYCDSVDHIFEIARINNDIKDAQRPWLIKAILATVPVGSSILEIGAGDPWVAQYLVECGYKVSIVDPYDGRDRGPSGFEAVSARYPSIDFYNGLFPAAIEHVPGIKFDCIYSISVLEHIAYTDIAEMSRAMKAFSRDGSSRIIHAIDLIQKGPGAEESIRDTREWLRVFGYKPGELDLLMLQMNNDAETYYLSAASHNMWRGGVPYNQYPMRRITSTHTCVKAEQLID